MHMYMIQPLAHAAHLSLRTAGGRPLLGRFHLTHHALQHEGDLLLYLSSQFARKDVGVGVDEGQGWGYSARPRPLSGT